MAAFRRVRSFILDCKTFVKVNAGSRCRRCFHSSYSYRHYERHFEPTVDILPYSKSRLVLRPMVFTLAVTSGSFVMAAILQYETLRSGFSKDFGARQSHLTRKSFTFRQELNKWWNALHPGQKTAAAIIGLNVGIFLLWRIPGLRYTMTKWFTSTPLSGLSLPMFLSCFSHIETWHLACNMVVLWSFSPAVYEMLGREQFMAFFVSGGLASAYFSHLLKLVTRSYVPSLGSSGCLLAVLAAVCVSYPDARVSILFLPFLTFSASKALMGIVAFDLAGLLFRWQVFDHAAHLGGIIFGSWYVLSGHRYLWDRREVMLRKWHDFRQRFKN